MTNLTSKIWMATLRHSLFIAAMLLIYCRANLLLLSYGHEDKRHCGERFFIAAFIFVGKERKNARARQISAARPAEGSSRPKKARFQDFRRWNPQNSRECLPGI